MPLTEAEKRAILEAKDDSLRKKLEEDYVANQLKIKENVRKIKREQNALKSEEKKKNKEGKSYWEIVDAEADQLLGKNFAGYNDWAMGMGDVLHISKIVFNAQWHDPINPVDLLPYRDEIYSGLLLVKDSIADKTVGKLGNFIEKHTTRTDEDLGRIIFHATVDDEGNLTSSVSKDKKPFPDLKHTFDVVIIAWAKVHGYENINCGGDAPVFQNAAGDKMTKAVFDGLNANPDTNLKAFMAGHFNFDVHYQPSVGGP